MVVQLAENVHNITIILSLHLLRKLIITALLTVVCKSTSFILNYLLTVDVFSFLLAVFAHHLFRDKINNQNVVRALRVFVFP